MEDLVIVWVTRDLHKKLSQQKVDGNFKTLREVQTQTMKQHKEKNKMPFDSISTIMFTLIFIVGFVFSILGLTDFCYAIEKKKTPWLGLIGSIIASIVWMSFSIVWVTGSTLDMFVAYGYLWLGLMLVCLMFAVASIGLILRNSVKPEEEPALQIRSETNGCT